MSELCSVPRVSERFAQSNALDEDIARLKYVSGKREEALRRLGIRTVGDLLLHIPHRYLDFTRSWSIEMAPIGAVCTIIATVDRIVQKQPRPRMQVTEVSLVDETGVLQVAFFRQPWIAQQLKQGDRLAVMGKVEFAYGFKQMASPHFEKLEEGRAAGTILPVHYVSDGVSQAWMRRIVSGALEVVGNPFDPIPAPLRAKRKLMSNARALRSIHFPSSMAERDIARARLAYEECLYLQLALRLRNDGGLVDVVPYAHTAGEHLAALKQALPFSLSDEQDAAFQDILHDMCDGGRVMNRLLLGDVGTGKTAVAACALAVAADSGTQACVMAPTSVLARQYADKTGPLLSQAGMSWALLTRATPASERERIHSQLESGELDVLFGTHAVLSDDVTFKHLSLVVIDEQHRFGVGQRNALRAKGPGADLLVMTATPIPRTLALSVYGDLDTSIIRHRPVPGAGVTTRVLTESSRDLAYGAIREAHAKGQQAYVICPLVEPSDSADELEDVPGIARDDEGRVTVPVPLHDTATELDRLRLALPGLVIERLHGRMPAGEKDRVIDAFRRGEIDVLVSTTVVEVGVDVPNATVMVIENGERFGLAALHQLRGRVGRSNQKGYCYLLSPPDELLSSDARRRLRAIEEFSDLGSGFNIAMQDLDIRGAGNLLGAEQSGFIADIGFETYQKIMNEAIAELRAEGLHVAGLNDSEQEVVEQLRYIDDAHIEIEVEAGLPDSYVAQQAERLKLYRELDSTKDEEALLAFGERLVDRFGPLPRETEELLNVVRLRWEAIRLGMERVKVKNGLMIVHFVGEQDSPYYKSDTFMDLLRKVTQNPGRFVLKQHNNRLAMTVRNVKDIEDAYKTLQQL